jgi:hypothetical protein
MTLRLGALHDALLNAGADPTLSQKAAEELADYDQQLAAMRTDLSVLKWMAGTLLALSLGNLWLCFSIVSRLP